MMSLYLFHENNDIEFVFFNKMTVAMGTPTAKPYLSNMDAAFPYHVRGLKTYLEDIQINEGYNLYNHVN